MIDPPATAVRRSSPGRGAGVLLGGWAALAVACTDPAETDDLQIVGEASEILMGEAPPDEPVRPARRAPKEPQSRASSADPSREDAPRSTPSPQAQAVQDEIARQAPQVQRCYERQLKQDDRLQGTVVVAFSITPGGSVRDTRVARDGVRVADLSDCVVRVVSRWRFTPHPGAPIVIEYPFRFRPKPF